ncbi:hypothetical protein BDZ97DRAFT_1800334 [Flammula alnicola]|nr:hypothetical protein BDZ97DRAFT_1800334 [Flammula alnicola]
MGAAGFLGALLCVGFLNPAEADVEVEATLPLALPAAAAEPSMDVCVLEVCDSCQKETYHFFAGSAAIPVTSFPRLRGNR